MNQTKNQEQNALVKFLLRMFKSFGSVSNPPLTQQSTDNKG